jgi:hypothetical protein
MVVQTLSRRCAFSDLGLGVGRARRIDTLRMLHAAASPRLRILLSVIRLPFILTLLSTGTSLCAYAKNT